MRRVLRALGALLVMLSASSPARAIIDQVDGLIVPRGEVGDTGGGTTWLAMCAGAYPGCSAVDCPVERLQACLDQSSAENLCRSINAVTDAAVLPESFRAVRDARTGRFDVTFVAIGEGAGFHNSFGWFWVGEDVTNPANLHPVLGCRAGPECACPCDQSRTVVVDFEAQPGFAEGRAIGFWLRTPELLTGSDEGGSITTCTEVPSVDVGCVPGAGAANRADDCGGRYDTGNRIYFTSQSLNDDGDYVHFLVYRSNTRANTFYFAFEDLFRGGDNDFEDMLVRASGLVPTCDPRPETCNGLDDDCDGMVDEGLARACSGACGSGTEVCVAGVYGGCDAPGAEPETCNGLDDDCDGAVDEGLSRACSTACGAGVELCTDGAYMGCTAPRPALEVCNGLDDDCDGMVDEGLSRACSSACGTGTERCVGGAFVGCDAPLPDVETCNNLDDDCDGVIDDGNPGGGASCVVTADGGYELVDPGAGPGGDAGAGVCLPGRVVCSAGELRCLGSSSPGREVCNCLDDDCDGEIDEDLGGGLCPGGAACIGCGCVSPCADTEFPCPVGKECVEGYCVAGSCTGVTCEAGQVCRDGACVDPCAGVSCPPDETCAFGRCVESNCYGTGCDPGLRCRRAECEPDPCFGTSCGPHEFCRDGACVASCGATTCGDRERCHDGACEADPCWARPCEPGAQCFDGVCVRDDECPGGCGRGRVCRIGGCVDDPCAGLRCPDDDRCIDGDCFAPGAEPGAPPPRGTDRVLASGGGGCVCDAGATSSSRGPWALVLAIALLGVAVARRVRRRVGRSARAGAPRARPGRVVARAGAALRRALGLVLAAGALLLGGCSVDPYCFDCDPGAKDGGSDADARADARSDARPADGCVRAGDEVCNGRDDDCNGIIDDGFDLANDPANCGACGARCELPGAFPGCELGDCTITRCEAGRVDLDGNPNNGCEYLCLTSGPELCDGVDNDCDSETDEGFDLGSDLANCGACGNLCLFPNAAATCVAGTCTMGACRDGFVDRNGLATDGCEYACTPAGAERCNGVDDDCDGVVDEGFDLLSDPANCGRCGQACAFPGGVAGCSAGVCDLARCADGFTDLDRDPTNGCEYRCGPPAAETCNGRDDDCDGATDEDVPMVGAPCGTTGGVCRMGVMRCEAGRLSCAGEVAPTIELCDGEDDDCDGSTDEGCPRLSPASDVRLDVGDPTGRENSVQPFVGGAGDAVYVTWLDRRSGAADVLLARSIDRGGLFSPPLRVDSGDPAGTSDSVRPELAALADAVHVVWSDFIGGGFRRVFARRSADRGGSFAGAEQRLNPGQDTDSFDAHVAVDGGNVYAVWENLDATRARHVYFARSIDGGASWMGAQRIDHAPAATFASDPRLAVGAPGNVFVVWRDNRVGRPDVFFNRSTNAGASFAGTDVRLDVGSAAGSSTSLTPRIAASAAGRVVVAWVDDRSGRAFDIYAIRSDDGGASWPASDVRVDDDPLPHESIAPTVMLLDDGAAVCVWIDYRDGLPDVYASRSDDGGASWPAGPARVDTGDAPGNSAAGEVVAATDGARVYAAWSDDRNGALDIYANFSLDAGVHWQPRDFRLDTTALPGSSDSETPAIWAGGGVAHVVWVDRRSGPSGDIYYRSIR